MFDCFTRTDKMFCDWFLPATKTKKYLSCDVGKNSVDRWVAANLPRAIYDVYNYTLHWRINWRPTIPIATNRNPRWFDWAPPFPQNQAYVYLTTHYISQKMFLLLNVYIDTRVSVYLKKTIVIVTYSSPSVNFFYGFLIVDGFVRRTF